MEVFEGNKLLVLFVVVVLNVGAFVGVISLDAPIIFLLLILFISAITLITIYTNKIIVAESMLQYKRLGKVDEVNLMQVAEIYIREMETFTVKSPEDNHHRSSGGLGKKGIQFGREEAELERRVEKIIYVVDEAGQTFFSFPQSLIPHKHRSRFRDAVHKVNPNVKVF